MPIIPKVIKTSARVKAGFILDTFVELQEMHCLSKNFKVPQTLAQVSRR